MIININKLVYNPEIFLDLQKILRKVMEISFCFKLNSNIFNFSLNIN